MKGNLVSKVFNKVSDEVRQGERHPNYKRRAYISNLIINLPLSLKYGLNINLRTGKAEPGYHFHLNEIIKSKLETHNINYEKFLALPRRVKKLRLNKLGDEELVYLCQEVKVI